MDAEDRKLNWAKGIFRIVGFLFVNVWLGYEFLKAEDPLKRLLPWDSGLAIATKWVLLPAAVIALYIYAIMFCIKGFNEPKLNWKEGMNRIGVVIGSLVLVVIFFLSWSWTNNILTALVIVGATAFVFFICILIENYLEEGFYKPDDDYYDDDDA